MGVSEDAAGAVIGKGDVKAQTEQVLKNVETILAAGGAKLEHVVKWNVYMVEGATATAWFRGVPERVGRPASEETSQSSLRFTPGFNGARRHSQDLSKPGTRHD